MHRHDQESTGKIKQEYKDLKRLKTKIKGSEKIINGDKNRKFVSILPRVASSREMALETASRVQQQEPVVAEQSDNETLTHKNHYIS